MTTSHDEEVIVTGNIHFWSNAFQLCSTRDFTLGVTSLFMMCPVYPAAVRARLTFTELFHAATLNMLHT